MAKTLYSNHLAGNIAQGDQHEIPIFMMTNEHLENTIRVKAWNFVKNRTKFAEAPKHDDPMVAAMGKSVAWDAEKLQKAALAFMEDIQAYVAEAAVRGGTILVQATESMRQVTRRDSAVLPPVEQLLLEDEDGNDKY